MLVSTLTVGFGCIVYAYLLLLRLPVGLARFIALLPWLPLLVGSAWVTETVHLRGLISFFYLWMIPFKMLLLCWNSGPVRDPLVTATFPRFFATMALSIHIPKLNTHHKVAQVEFESYWDWVQDSLQWQAVLIRAVFKFILVVLLFGAYAFRHDLPQLVIYFVYSLHIYLACSLIFEIMASVASGSMGVKLEPQFDKPFLATSLSEFWGKRWNHLVSSVLRASVYHPVISLINSNSDFARGVALLATFLVSGLMHELIFFFLNRSPPTWQVTGFFLLQGVAIVAERNWNIKYTSDGIGRVATVGFIFLTAAWLFFPPIHTTGTCYRALSEFEYFLSSTIHRISN